MKPFVSLSSPVLSCERKMQKSTIPFITFNPAKNGARLFFVGDHTFFGDVVNIAETLQVICWYKVMDVSLYTSSLIMFSSQTTTKKHGLYSVQQQ